MKRAAVILLSALSLALGLVQAYSVEPVKASWSGFTDTIRPYNYVSQTVTCCFDSLAYVELFAGEQGQGGTYDCDVYDVPSETRVAFRHEVQPGQPCDWLEFSGFTFTGTFTKGKVYEFRFTRSGTDSINYYYSEAGSGGPYGYGRLVLSGGDSPPPSPDADLCLRVYGVMNAVDSVWRACVNHGNNPLPDSGGYAALAAARGLGVAWLRDDFEAWEKWATDSSRVMGIYHRYLDSGFSSMGILCFGRNDTAISSCPPLSSVTGLEMYPPRNLYLGETDANNFWSSYCRSVMESMPGVKYWEVWPEANGSWFWRDPDTHYYKGAKAGPLGDSCIDTPRERCSLYVQMCRLARRAADSLPDKKIVAGGVWRLTRDLGSVASPGVDWLQDMFDLADRRYGGVGSCFDIVSVHPYLHEIVGPGLDTLGFREAAFHRDLDTARAVMRAAGYPGMELWATEYGWPRWTNGGPPHRPLTDTLQQADNLCKFYVTALGRQADPRGGYDRAFIYELTGRHSTHDIIIDNQGFGLLDTTPAQTPLPQSWGFAHAGELLTGKRFNGRVLLGDARDDSCRIYEFEDSTAAPKRTWMAWMNDDGTDQPSVVAALPVRADANDSVALDYDGFGTTSDTKSADQDGWLRTTLTTRPVFITESATETLSRPDLVVDSVRLSPLQVWRPGTIRAYVKNIGNRATPGYLAQDSIDMQHPTWVHFYRNDVIIDSVRSNTSIAPGATRAYTLTLDPVPEWMHGTALYSARANPRQTYVEKAGLDDNAGYIKGMVLHAPTGALDAVVPEPGVSNLPVIGLHLASASFEQDTTGQTPADSFRLRQVHYAFGDSIPDDSVTSAWAAFRTDTVVALALGAGRYRLMAQYKDCGDNESDWVQDTSFALLAFDAAAPAGSLDLNSGARFATVPACTVRVSGSDSGAGLATLRLSHSSCANLLDNPAFDTDAGWTLDGGAGCDESLGLAVLPVTSGTAAAVSQPVAFAQLSPLIGDSCRLSCDLVVSVDSACSTAVGSLCFSYRYCFLPDTLQPDSLLPVASVSFAGGLRSFCARSPLSADLLLPAPGSGAQWQWQGGLVTLSTQAPAGLSGTAWADNLRLAPCGPESDYGWDAPYDSLSLWTIAGSPGPHPVRGLITDSCGNESAVFADTIILDTTPPVADIYQPLSGSKVNKTVKLTGLGYDPVEVPGDSWFCCYRLDYRHKDSTEYLPVVPDSVSYAPCYPAGPGLPGALGDWNTVLVPDGQYYLRLTACDSAGHESGDEVWVTVQNNTVTPKSQAGGPAGAVSLDAAGADYTGSAQGRIVRIGEELDSLAGFVFADSGTPAWVAAVVELDSGHLLCADLRTGDLSKLTKDGAGQEKLIEGLGLPVDLALDARGNVWTIDKGGSQLHCHAPDGTALLALGGPGTDSTSFNYPEAVTVGDGLVYVADTRNDRLAVYDTAGNLNRLIQGNFDEPCAIVVTADNALYLIDKQLGTIEGINQLGGHLLTIEPPDAGQFRGLGLASDGRDLVTLIPGAGGIARYEVRTPDSLPGGIQGNQSLRLPARLVLHQPLPNPMRDRLTIRYGIARPGRASLRVWDASGRLCRTLIDGPSKPGWYTTVWDRTDGHGRTAANGVYFIKLESEGNPAQQKKVVLSR